ncbi:MAG: LPS-assembly protein LptD [Janthinobacterium lividum]
MRTRTIGKTTPRKRVGVNGRACACAVLALSFVGIGTLAASAQQAAPAAAPQPAEKKDRLLVEAKQLVYNRDTNVVSADGTVQLYYQGRVLEADKVIYDRNSNRVFASGHAKMTEADGSVSYSDKFELTDDFKTGFVNSLSTISKDKTFFTAPRAERSEGETTTFEKGTYTACAPCAAHPERPPLWQVKAMKIIHKADEQMIYFEDATLELYGVPIAYVPYFSTPDPTVARKTGFLTPHYVTESRLGFGAAQPFFWNLAPNYDLTLTPTVLSKQGFFGEAEWRHRLETGSYSVLVSGIDQLDPKQYSLPPAGSGQRDFRGSIESTGKFFINPSWQYGWDVALFSDKYFVQDYNIRSSSLGSDYIKESISTAYLIGQGDRSYFNLEGYRIVGLSQFDNNQQQPLVLPTVDYNRTFGLAPDQTAGLGGEVKLDFNLTSLSRTEAAYQSSGTRLLDSAFSLYDVCSTYATPVVGLPNFKPPSCFMRGIAGDYSRASTQVSWERKFIDPIGEVWKPFAFVRADGRWLNLNESDSFTYTSTKGQSTISNGDQANFFGTHNENISGDVVPGVGLEYRYPFLATNSWVSQVVEPIAQIIARPNVAQAGKTPNEDAQSLVFDDTTLFEWNKYSGYDRVEGGVRANAGGQYTATFNNGGYVNALFGQSYALAGQNSYALQDVSNVGLNSGLETDRSDYVGRLIVAPALGYSVTAKSRFDSKTFEPKVIDLIGSAKFFGLTSSVQYSNYAAQPDIGYVHDRSGVLLSERFDFLDHYYVNGSATVELDPYQYDFNTLQYDLKTGHPQIAVLGAGLGYQDDCTTLSVSYTRSYTNSISGTASDLSTNQTVLVSLSLRTLADFKLNQSLGATSTVQDGVFK